MGSTFIYFVEIRNTFSLIDLSNYIPFLFLGVFNRYAKNIRSVFLCYSGNERYAGHYGFKILEPYLKWFPTPIGIYKQGRFWGIVFASSMTEGDFTAPENRPNLEKIINRLKFIRALVGADQIQMAGVLPSFIERKIPALKIQSSHLVSKAVVAAAAKIQNTNFHGKNIPVVLLGGNGKIGKMLQKELTSFEEIYVVDPNSGLAELPSHLYGKDILLIDVSRTGSLVKYYEQLWPEIVVLNETFPEPRGKGLRSIQRRGLKIYHLAGVSGRVYPSLPLGYSGSVPCCAIHDFDQGLQPILLELC